DNTPSIMVVDSLDLRQPAWAEAGENRRASVTDRSKRMTVSFSVEKIAGPSSTPDLNGDPSATTKKAREGKSRAFLRVASLVARSQERLRSYVDGGAPRRSAMN